MGYSTMYNLSVHTDSSLGIREVFQKANDFYGLHYAIDEAGEYVNSVKWDEHEEDMLKLSVEFPDVIFILKGEGEEAGDIWYKCFKSGKIQRAPGKITFDEYDESKLE